MLIFDNNNCAHCLLGRKFRNVAFKHEILITNWLSYQSFDQPDPDNGRLTNF